MRGIPVVHEVAAGIAAEYFHEIAEGERAFALVTPGPGLTNVLTAVAGAWVEGRELLVVGGQVKIADLSRGQVRQRGIQEVDGVALTAPITIQAVRMDAPMERAAFAALTQSGSAGHTGPVFVEVPLDVQACPVELAALTARPVAALGAAVPALAAADVARLAARIKAASRPVLLVGGGVSRAAAVVLETQAAAWGVPLMTTYNGCDRVASEHPLYFGRPNMWGMRYSNVLLQQADLVVALGTRLGLQQTGFRWEEFVPVGALVQIDCDKAELEKGHPRVDWALCGDANQALRDLAGMDLGTHEPWVAYCREVKAALPLNEACNRTGAGYISPYAFNLALSALAQPSDIVVPCSSGGAFTVTFQSFLAKRGQKMLADKSLASMGYGLSGAIGAAVAAKGRRTLLIEGDGGFAQNMQEIGTLAINKLNVKIFIFDDKGYASIRMTQSQYFGGHYVGCDIATGLGLPDWDKLFPVWDVPVMRLKAGFENDPAFLELFNAAGPAAFLVPVDPQQTYFPKITSRMTPEGAMVSNPLHRMSPDLEDAVFAKVGRWLGEAKEGKA